MSSSSKNIEQSTKNDLKYDKSYFDKLDIICIHKILWKLNLTGLVNVVDAYPQLTVDAHSIFTRKYAQKRTIYIKMKGEVRVHCDKEIVQTPVEAFLKIFGHLLQGLSVCYYGLKNDQIWRGIERTITKFCVKSLTSFEVYAAQKSSMLGFQEPFKNVKTLRLNRSVCFTSLEILQHNGLTRMFPNVKYLRVYISDTPNWLNSDLKFRYLESIELVNHADFQNREMEITAERILRNHRFINNLKIDFFCCTKTFIKFLSSELPCLSVLSLSTWLLIFEDYVGSFNGIIHFPNVKHLSLTHNRLPHDIVFDQLRSLAFQKFSSGEDSLPYVDCHDFISQYPDIEKLVFCSTLTADISTVVEIIKLLPNLKELELGFAPVDEVIKFLQTPSFKLKRLEFYTSQFDIESRDKKIFEDHRKSINSLFKQRFHTTIERGMIYPFADVWSKLIITQK